MSKIDHMMAILWMLHSGRKITAQQIAEKLELHIRTVYRYMDSLSASGVPIIAEAGHNGGYTLLNHFIKSPLFFNAQEQAALQHAAAFARNAGYFLGESLDSATSKLGMHASQEQELVIEQHIRGLDVISPNGRLPIEPVLKKLEQAVVNEKTVELTYRSNREDQPKCRLVDPYGLIYWNRYWYVIAFCHLRDDIRSFRVDLIIRYEQTDDAFERPASFSAADYFMNSLLPKAPDKEGHISLVIGGKASAIDNLCQHWYLGHHLKERSSDKAIFLLEEEAIHTYVPYLLLPYGKSVQVMEPASLKHKLIEILYELVDFYQA